ncbi:MAG: UDP-N-acetylmuramate dehydrogenase [Anaerolineae bacterium]|nr:UDP-N-acetylmuramate dehydrogenase [Anaerolineae bacterium]
MSDKLASLAIELQNAGLTVLHDEPMSRHTTYEIGGPADLFVQAASREQMILAFNKARAVGFIPLILGGGAEILVADAGIRGAVIHYTAAQYRFTPQDGEVRVWAEAGASFQDLARESVSRALEGLHWAVDIPGSIGGAVVGNAGAFGGYICDCVVGATLLEMDGAVREIFAAEIAFCYRGSRLKQMPRDERPVILDVTLTLRPGDPQWLAEMAAQYTQRRWERNPREPSCGSVFKRTANYPAGFLIEQCGLKGERRGNAMISPLHANFIINLGGARAVEVKALIDLAQERVKAQFGETLEPEIELVGEW